MADYEQEIGLVGGIADETAAILISRRADGAAVQFGDPVQESGTDGDACEKGIAAGTFLGIATREAGLSEFAEDAEVRILTQGTIWVTAAVAVSAGDPVIYDNGWKKSGTTKPQITTAVYETSASATELVKVRLWGTTVADTAA